MNNIISRPNIPFVMTVPGGKMTTGTIVIIQGSPLSSCNRFCVNFLDGYKMKCIFHFDVRFDCGSTVRNSNYPVDWGIEEVSPLTLQRGQFFFMEFRCLQDKFMVAIDGQHYCEFRHRQPLQSISTLQIQGDVRVDLIEFKQGSVYPTPDPRPPVYFRLNVDNPSLPFTAPIGGPFQVGNEIQVHCRVKQCPNRFSINLQQGAFTYPHPTIAFHFNPRFEGGDRVIVMNTFSNNNWGAEQRIPARNNPFHANKNFIVIIRRQSPHFDVLVNGQYLTTFKHRIHADVIDSVAVDGDIVVSKVLAV